VLLASTDCLPRRFQVIRRPYVLVHESEKDPVTRALINLSAATIEYSVEGQELLGVRNTFSIITKHRGYLLQSIEGKDVFDWLYALNPLLAGQLKSKLARSAAATRSKETASS